MKIFIVALIVYFVAQSVSAFIALHHIFPSLKLGIEECEKVNSDGSVEA